MGHQIYAGNSDLCFTSGAWQVMHWCERFTPRTKPHGMSDWQWADELVGSSEASVASVKLANEKVPTDYNAALAAGLVDDGIGPDEFNQCREFLRLAADAGVPINGSY